MLPASFDELRLRHGQQLHLSLNVNRNERPTMHAEAQCKAMQAVLISPLPARSGMQCKTLNRPISNSSLLRTTFEV